MSQDKLNSTDRFVGGLENIDGNLRAGEVISAGDVVEYNGTATGTVADVQRGANSGSAIAGVALVDAASAGDPITVAQVGAEVRTNASDGGISPGDQLVSAGNGSVIRASQGSAGDAVVGQSKTNEDNQGEVVMLVNNGGDFHG